METHAERRSCPSFLEFIPFGICHGLIVQLFHLTEYNQAMAVLVINLDRDETEKKEAAFKGLEGAIKLYREHEGENPIVISAPSAEALRFQGSAFFSFVFRSPITGRMVVASSGLAPGYSLFRLGYESVVITGRARKLSTLYINADGAESVVSESFRGLASADAEMKAKRNISDVGMAIGRSGENGVLYAALQSGGHEIASSGLGCLFGWKNIKAVILPGFLRKDSLGNGKTERKAVRRQEKCKITRQLRKEGGGLFIDSALRLGWLPVSYYTERFDPRAFFLDGKTVIDEYGVYPESCQDCYFSCGRRTKGNKILPSWQECSMLGSNLGFFSIETVGAIADAVREEGLGINETGAILSYLSTLPGSDYTLPVLKGKGPDEYIRIIHLIGENRGLGEKLSAGLASFPDAIATLDHLPITTDLRGDKTSALAVLLGIPISLPASLLLPRRPLSDKAAAIMMLYEGAYRFALVSDGYSPMGMISEWWGRFPSFVFRIPFLLRLICLLFSAYGLRGNDIFMKGLKLMEAFGNDCAGTLPEHFIMDPESAYGDGATVSPVKLMECYSREKRIALRMLKSRSEKSSIPSADKTAAVGPSDDRGRDGDPGLQNTTPSSS